MQMTLTAAVWPPLSLTSSAQSISSAMISRTPMSKRLVKNDFSTMRLLLLMKSATLAEANLAQISCMPSVSRLTKRW